MTSGPRFVCTPCKTASFLHNNLLCTSLILYPYQQRPHIFNFLWRRTFEMKMCRFEPVLQELFFITGTLLDLDIFIQCFLYTEADQWRPNSSSWIFSFVNSHQAETCWRLTTSFMTPMFCLTVWLSQYKSPWSTIPGKDPPVRKSTNTLHRRQKSLFTILDRILWFNL